VSRRGFLGTGLGVGLGLAAGASGARTLLAASPASAQPAARAPGPRGDVITRPFGRSSERIPAIGLGTFMTFDLVPGQPRGHLREVVKRFWDGGGRLVDTSPLYGTPELNVGQIAAALDITDRLFIADKLWVTGEHLHDPSHAERSLAMSRGRLWRDKLDAIQCHSLVNVDSIVPLLQAWKKEGKVRHIGVTHHEPAYFPMLADWIERGKLDVVQVHYSIHTRAAEDRVLRVAADQGAAVLVNMPLEKARLMKIVEGRPLPDFAREFGVRTWAQFFLSWVIAHPAVTCALVATSNPEHAAENVATLRGPLPDAAMRARMLRHMQSIPGFERLDKMPWYPDRRYDGLVGQSQKALQART
jgi:diketogulonate reductase-like aldo/keto reductase